MNGPALFWLCGPLGDGEGNQKERSQQPLPKGMGQKGKKRRQLGFFPNQASHHPDTQAKEENRQQLNHLLRDFQFMFDHVVIAPGGHMIHHIIPSGLVKDVFVSIDAIPGMGGIIEGMIGLVMGHIPLGVAFLPLMVVTLPMGSMLIPGVGLGWGVPPFFPFFIRPPDFKADLFRIIHRFSFLHHFNIKGDGLTSGMGSIRFGAKGHLYGRLGQMGVSLSFPVGTAGGKEKQKEQDPHAL